MAPLCGLPTLRLCFAPVAGPYWGLVPVLPYFGAFFVQMNDPSTIGAEFASIGYGLLLAALAVPWLAGFSAGLARKQARPPNTSVLGGLDESAENYRVTASRASIRPEP